MFHWCLGNFQLMKIEVEHLGNSDSCVHWNWYIIDPTSHHGELPLYQQKENNFFALI